MRTETRPCQAKSPMLNMTPSGLRPHTVSESSLCEAKLPLRGQISWNGQLWPAAERARACVKEADHEHSEPPGDRRCSGVRVHPGSLEQQHREDCPDPATRRLTTAEAPNTVGYRSLVIPLTKCGIELPARMPARKVRRVVCHMVLQLKTFRKRPLPL